MMALLKKSSGRIINISMGAMVDPFAIQLTMQKFAFNNDVIDSLEKSYTMAKTLCLGRGLLQRNELIKVEKRIYSRIIAHVREHNK